MLVFLFDKALPLWPDIGTAALTGALVKSSWVPDLTDEFADVFAGDEFTDPTYARQLITGSVQTIEPGGANLVRYSWDDVDFGPVDGGEVAAWFAVFDDTGSDATSPLWAAYRVNRAADGIDLVVASNTLGNAYAQQRATF